MTKEIALKYGCNPNQKPARIYLNDQELPVTVLNGKPGYINFLDALNSWQLVKELKEATGYPSAASFKHVSPAGAAIGTPLSEVERKIYFTGDEEFAALSDICDKDTALLLKKEVSDGVIAPGYTEEALEILKAKKKGNYAVIQIDPTYVPEEIERKQVFGIYFEQGRNNVHIDESLLTNFVTKNTELTEQAKLDLLIAMITLKYTQSNSVVYAKNGQVIGVGAGQQSRIHCTRLAGSKADNWWLRQHEKVLNLPFKEDIRRADRDNTIDIYLSEDYEDVLQDGAWQQFFTEQPSVFTREEKKAWIKQQHDVALGSDAFFPFGDNIERAYKSGVKYVVQPGGSIRDDHVIDTCDKYDIVMVCNGVRLFHH